ncbi:MAG: hypothetical protein ACR2M7_02965 [Bdellovibrionales bacterium]
MPKSTRQIASELRSCLSDATTDRGERICRTTARQDRELADLVDSIIRQLQRNGSLGRRGRLTDRALIRSTIARLRTANSASAVRNFIQAAVATQRTIDRRNTN